MQNAVERLINGNHLRPGPTFFIGFSTPRWTREGMDGGNELCGVIITTSVLMLDRFTRSRAEYVQACIRLHDVLCHDKNEYQNKSKQAKNSD